MPKRITDDDEMPRRRRGAKAVAVEADEERGFAMRILLHSPKDMLAGALAVAALDGAAAVATGAPPLVGTTWANAAAAEAARADICGAAGAAGGVGALATAPCAACRCSAASMVRAATRRCRHWRSSGHASSSSATAQASRLAEISVVGSICMGVCT